LSYQQQEKAMTDLDYEDDIEMPSKEHLRNMIQLAIKTLNDHSADQVARNYVASALGDALADNEQFLWG
jgi:hypothetical protein